MGNKGVKWIGVITGIKYSETDVKKNKLPECVCKVAENTSDERIKEIIADERIERNCRDCQGCTSYGYYI